MAKKPTPKRKHNESRGKKRYSMFQYLARTRLKNMTHLVDCAQCQQKRRTHHVCPHCGYYRGRKVVDMSKAVKEQITKVQA